MLRTTSILKDLPILTPPLEEQLEIVRTLQAIDNRIVNCEAFLEKQQALKKALMQDLLTGKKRVAA